MITSPPEPEVEVDIERMFHELEEEAEQLRASREMFQLDAGKYRDESRAKDFEIARLLAEIERLERENKRLRWLMTVAQAVR